MPYAEIFEAFPADLRLPLARLVDTLKAELDAHQSDFEPLRAAVQELVAAQARTEARVDRLVVAVEALSAAQARTEARMEELAAAQARTEARVDRLAVAVEALSAAQARTEVRMEELAAAQARTEARVDRLTVAVEALSAAQARTEVRMEELAAAQARTEVRMEELAAAQARTQDELTLFRRTFTSQIGGLGARWGMQTEAAFREGIRAILQEVGFTTERFLTWDAAGEVFGHPDQVELDVVVRNGAVIVVEIKSSLDRANTYLFDRKVAFYTRHTGRQVARKVVVAPYADERAQEVARHLGIEVCTEVTAFE